MIDYAPDDANQGPVAILSRMELAVAATAVSGATIREAAEIFGITEETAKSYVRRAREKFRAAGIDAGTQVLLQRALRAGRWCPSPYQWQIAQRARRREKLAA